MPLLYECLPEFCYYCGRIGHAYKDSENMPKDEKGENFSYGGRLKATMIAVKIKQERRNRGRKAQTKAVRALWVVKRGNHAEWWPT